MKKKKKILLCSLFQGSDSTVDLREFLLISSQLFFDFFDILLNLFSDALDGVFIVIPSSSIPSELSEPCLYVSCFVQFLSFWVC